MHLNPRPIMMGTSPLTMYSPTILFLFLMLLIRMGNISIPAGQSELFKSQNLTMEKKYNATIADTCLDDDCLDKHDVGYCTKNAGSNGALVDVLHNDEQFWRHRRSGRVNDLHSFLEIV